MVVEWSYTIPWGCLLDHKDGWIMQQTWGAKVLLCFYVLSEYYCSALIFFLLEDFTIGDLIWAIEPEYCVICFRNRPPLSFEAPSYPKPFFLLINYFASPWLLWFYDLSISDKIVIVFLNLYINLVKVHLIIQRVKFSKPASNFHDS